MEEILLLGLKDREVIQIQILTAFLSSVNNFKF
jgi:hypothetical protein